MACSWIHPNSKGGEHNLPAHFAAVTYAREQEKHFKTNKLKTKKIWTK